MIACSSIKLLGPCVLALSLAACAQFPALDGTVPPSAQAASYPTLVPLEPLLAGIEATSTDPVATSSSVNARVARLKNRAAQLRQTVIDGETRTRMSGGIAPSDG